jgi:hypothetical protein
MNRDILRDIRDRLARHEREMVRFRRGEVTDDSPLTVALGGSSETYVDVKAVEGTAFVVADQVAVLVWGNDLIVLGVIA